MQIIANKMKTGNYFVKPGYFVGKHVRI